MGLVGWKYKREIQLINTTSFNLENYIVGISLDSSNFDFSKARFDGSDIRFTDSDGVTLLDYYVEDYDYDKQEAIICVKAPSIPANQTKSIYMYYGNMNAVSQSNKSIMTSGFQYSPDPFNDGSCIAFYPFDEDANDHSGNEHHGTWHGNEQYDKGIFGQCAKFDGGSWIEISGNIEQYFTENKSWSISCWARWDALNYWSRVLDFKGYILIANKEATNRLEIHHRPDQLHNTALIIENFINLKTIYHIVVVCDSSNNKYFVFINNNSINFSWGFGSGRPNQPINAFGRSSWGGNSLFNGLIDQVRIFNRALTDDEIFLLSTYIPSTILDEVQVKSRASGVIVDTNGNPIINTPIKIYLLNPDTGHLVDSTDCNTDASWEINNVPAEPGEEVISVFKSNDSSQKLTGAGVVVTQEVNE